MGTRFVYLVTAPLTNFTPADGAEYYAGYSRLLVTQSNVKAALSVEKEGRHVLTSL